MEHLHYKHYKLAEYLETVQDMKQRRVLTKLRLGEHGVGIKNPGYQKNREYVRHCMTGEVETEVNFLIK